MPCSRQVDYLTPDHQFLSGRTALCSLAFALQSVIKKEEIVKNKTVPPRSGNKILVSVTHLYRIIDVSSVQCQGRHVLRHYC